MEAGASLGTWLFIFGIPVFWATLIAWSVLKLGKIEGR